MTTDPHGTMETTCIVACFAERPHHGQSWLQNKAHIEMPQSTGLCKDAQGSLGISSEAWEALGHIVTHQMHREDAHRGGGHGETEEHTEMHAESRDY